MQMAGLPPCLPERGSGAVCDSSDEVHWYLNINCRVVDLKKIKARKEKQQHQPADGRGFRRLRL